MNEVRDIVARMMEDPAPPPRPAEEVLAVARRADRRRSWAAAAASGALALLLVGGVGIAVRSLQPSTPATTVVAGPVGQVPPAHGAMMAQRIVASLPVGIVAGMVETFSDDPQPVTAADDGRVQILAATVVRVFGGKGEGEVYAYLVRDGGSEPEAACASDATECWVVLVGGVTIQVVTRSDLDRGQQIEATRFLDGGRLIVGAWSGPPADGTGPTGLRYGITWPPLGESPLDGPSLAALAADPAMLAV